MKQFYTPEEPQMTPEQEGFDTTTNDATTNGWWTTNNGSGLWYVR
jgi:hypothetical protein